MQTKRVATNATAVAPTTHVVTKAKGANMTLGLEITGGSARTAQFQGAFTKSGPWFNIGTSRTTIGQFVETVAAMPFVRLNVSANTGSTLNAWIASQ